MIKPRTVGIVGMGHVGAHVANSLLLQGLADELYLCDIDFVKIRVRDAGFARFAYVLSVQR